MAFNVGRLLLIFTVALAAALLVVSVVQAQHLGLDGVDLGDGHIGATSGHVTGGSGTAGDGGGVGGGVVTDGPSGQQQGGHDHDHGHS